MADLNALSLQVNAELKLHLFDVFPCLRPIMHLHAYK